MKEHNRQKKGGIWHGIKKAVAIAVSVAAFGFLASLPYVNYHSIISTKMTPLSTSPITSYKSDSVQSTIDLLTEENYDDSIQDNSMTGWLKNIRQIPNLIGNLEIHLNNSGRLSNKVYEKLEDKITSSIKPEDVELTEWEESTLARLIAINGFIEKYSNYYGNDVLIEAQILLLESSYNPLAVGPQKEIGLGQILPQNEESLRTLMGNRLSRYYCPYYDSSRSLWDPETNVIAASLALRKKIDIIGAKDYDRAYAYYVLGSGAFDKNGNFTKPAAEVVASMHQRYDYLRRILPILKFNREDIMKIKDANVRDLLLINLDAEDGVETYQRLCDYFLDKVSKQAVPSWEHVLMLEDYFVSSSTLNIIYKNNTGNYYSQILKELNKVNVVKITDSDLKAYYIWLITNVKK